MQDFGKAQKKAVTAPGLLLAVWCCALPLHAENGTPPARLVDMHTAGVVPRGNVLIESRIYEGAGTGLMVSAAVGVTDRFCFGLGYGADGIVGRSRDPKYDPFPGCLVKYRVFDENYFFPGFAVGFDYQGFGGIADDTLLGYRGYNYKSEGFFLAASKSYLFFRKIALGFHGNANFSLEEISKVSWPDAWVGIDIGVSESFALVAEYDFALNTRDPANRAGKEYALPQDGYFNAGVKWNLSEYLALELDARDILQNRSYLVPGGAGQVERRLGWAREIKVIYTAPIRG